MPVVVREPAIHDSPLGRNRVVLEPGVAERNIHLPIPAANPPHWNHIVDAVADLRERADVLRAAREALPAVDDE